MLVDLLAVGTAVLKALKMVVLKVDCLGRLLVGNLAEKMVEETVGAKVYWKESKLVVAMVALKVDMKVDNSVV